LFIALYAISIVVGVVAGFLIVMGTRDFSLKKLIGSAKFNWFYVVLIVTAPILTLVEHLFKHPSETYSEIVYTNWIFSIGGNAIRILQDRLDYQILSDFFIVIYVWVFTFILYFTPILILALDDRRTFRRYSIAMLLNYVVLMPFYLFFPVSVTGFYADSGVTPLLYIDTNWGRVVTSVDPLDNDFPSGHVSLIVTTLLVLVAAGRDYKTYYYFVGLATAAIVFAVLYLGVHWIADVFAGFLLAVGATVLSKNERVAMGFDRLVRRISAKIFKENVEAG
jgi:membrane-associated phospholipid phosphatase